MSEEESGFGPPEGQIDSLQDVLARIESSKPPRATKTNRERMLRFLTGDLPPQIASLEPWCESRWRKLRRRLANDREALWLLYVEIYTAIEDSERDADVERRILIARDNWPSKNRLDELRPEILQELLAALGATGEVLEPSDVGALQGRLLAAIQDDSDANPVKALLDSRAFEVPASAGGQDSIAWMTKREVLFRSHGNSGRLRAERTDEDRLMWLLTGERFKLSANAAAHLTCQILEWFLGESEPKRSPKAIMTRHSREK